MIFRTIQGIVTSDYNNTLCVQIDNKFTVWIPKTIRERYRKGSSLYVEGEEIHPIKTIPESTAILAHKITKMG